MRGSHTAREKSIPIAVLLLALGSGPAAGQEPDSGNLLDMLATPVRAAARYDQATADAPASVRVVTADEIERYGWVTLDELLATIPGFHTSSDRNYAYVGVRGFGRPTDYNNRILLLIDGQPTNEVFYGSPAVGGDLGIDLRGLERVEVVRGPGSALFGGNAMFAVVNLVSKDVDGGRLWIRGGSGGVLRGGASAGTVAGGARVRAESGWERTDGEDLRFPELAPAGDDGRVVGMDGSARRFGAMSVAWAGLTLRARTWRQEKEVPTAAWGSDFRDRRLRTEDEWTVARVGWDGDVGVGLHLDGGVSWVDYDYVGRYPVDGVLTWDDNAVSRVAADVQLTWDPRPHNRIVLGGDYRRHVRASYRNWDGEDWTFDADFPGRSWSVYLQNEYHVTPDLVLLGGVRYDRLWQGEGRATPRFAVLFEPVSATVLKLLYGRAFRAPSVYETHYEDPYGFRPSGGLEAEEVQTLEAVWEQRIGDRGLATLGAWVTGVEGLVDTEEETGGVYRFVNRDAVRAHGFEAEVTARSADGAAARASYSWARAGIRGGEPLSNVPRHVFRWALEGPLPGPLAGAVEARWETGRLTLRGDRTEAALLADLHLSGPALLGGLTPRLDVRNLLDADFAVPAGYEHVQTTIPQPGRRLEVGADYRF